MKTHLRILFGADDRYQLVQQTIDVSAEYFDTVRIVNSGPSELALQFHTLPKNVCIETLNFFCGDLESARNAFLYDVDLGDYVLWLDADERPTKLFLDNIDKIIAETEQRKIWGVRSIGCNHLWADDGRCLHGEWDFNDKYKFPLNAEDYGEKENAFLRGEYPVRPNSSIGRMVKKVSPFISSATNFGGHGNILNYKNNYDMFYAPYPLIHIKHEIMVFQSFVTCTYVNPCLNAPIKDGYKPYVNSVEYKMLREFQIRTGVKSQNDLCKKLHLNIDLKFKNELRSLFESPEFANSVLYDNFFKHYQVWAKRYDLSWKTPPVFCGKPCCRYNNIQL